MLMRPPPPPPPPKNNTDADDTANISVVLAPFMWGARRGAAWYRNMATEEATQPLNLNR